MSAPNPISSSSRSTSPTQRDPEDAADKQARLDSFNKIIRVVNEIHQQAKNVLNGQAHPDSGLQRQILQSQLTEMQKATFDLISLDLKKAMSKMNENSDASSS